MTRGEDKGQKVSSCGPCAAKTCSDFGPHFSSTPGESHSERSTRHLSLSDEGKVESCTVCGAKRLCRLMRNDKLHWTVISLRSLQIGVESSSHWLVRLHSVHEPLDENASHLSFFYLPLCISAIKHTPRTLMTAGRRTSAVISAQAALHNSSISSGWENNNIIICISYIRILIRRKS